MNLIIRNEIGEIQKILELFRFVCKCCLFVNIVLRKFLNFFNFFYVEMYILIIIERLQLLIIYEMYYIIYNNRCGDS